MKKLILSCMLLLIACNNDSTIIGSDGDTDNYICGNDILEPGEECDNEFLSCNECHFSRKIFISSSTFNAMEIGSLNLDEICTDEAIESNINTNKTWKAWVSKNNASIKDNIYNSPGLYVSYTDDIVAYSFSDLTDGSINKPIIFDNYGIEQLNKDVWTGTLSNGSYAYGNCDNWTLSVGESGTVGRTNTITADWTNTQDLQDCASKKLIYCIEDKIIN